MSMRLNFNRGLAVSLAVLTLSGLVAQSTWQRVYAKGTDLSLELPGKLSDPETEKIDDEKDWVTETTDWTFDSEDFFVQVTKFKGKASTQATAEFLKSVGEDYMKGIAESGDKVEATGSELVKVDNKPAWRLKRTVGEGNNQYFLNVVFVGDGRDVYSVAGISFPDAKQGVTDVDRIIKSVRYKKGL
ncbi:hypothetical protein QPK87_07005 [Kamptonema cortianum]|nr:hypothetical protein [Geitlerinema splendidum]MDK3156322.1 hypothetical protein [Kamptonema cortianum]